MKSRRFALAVALVAALLTLDSAGAHGRVRLQQTPPTQAPPATAQKPAEQAQKPQQQNPQQPTFRAGVNLVRVDVIVTDRDGAPLHDLTAADFDVTEDGKPQKIDTFKLIQVQTTQQPGGIAPREIRSLDDEELETSREDIRMVVLFLDDYHVAWDGGVRVRAPLRRFVDTQIGPYDLVAVMYPLMPVSALRFTHDHYILGTAVATFEGRKGNYAVRNDAEATYGGAPPAVIEEIRNKVTLSALESLMNHLGALREGRKSVILVSEGFLLPIEDMDDLRRVYDAANRNNAAIYVLDPRGLTMATNTWTMDTLRALADNTDGRAIVNSNDLEMGLRQVIRDSSAYYLIGYSSDRPAADGKFHEIKVRVKRPGLQVRARKGYWAPTAEEAAKALEPPKPGAPPTVTNALASLVEPRGRAIRTWIGMSRGDNGRTRVTFVWEPIPPAPGSERGDRPARVVLVASAPNGATYFSGPVDARPIEKNVPRTSPGAAAARGPSRAVFDAPPGRLQMKVTVEGASSDVLESDTRDINVPDLGGAQVMLSTPAVFSARTPRESRALSSDPDVVPTPDRQFSRTERLQIRFDAYAPGLAAPTVTARLLNRNGNEMSALTLQASAQHPGQHTIDLPLATLPSGEYLIEISAKGETGEATAMVAMRITG